MCILLQACALPGKSSPFGPLPGPLRHRIALFLLRLSQESDRFLEPSLEELGLQLRDSFEDIGDELAERLTSRLQEFSSPDHLIEFFIGLKKLLARSVNVVSEVGNGDDEALLVDPNSILGQYLRRCILSFNLLSFEESCKLLMDVDAYHQSVLNVSGLEPLVGSCYSKKDGNEDVEDEDGKGEVEEFLDIENLDAEGRLLESQQSGLDAETSGHRNFFGFRYVSGELPPLTVSGIGGTMRDGSFAFPFSAISSRRQGSIEGVSLSTFGQVEAYLKVQTDLMERQATAFPAGELDANLKRLEKLAPDLHRVHYLRYLNFLQNGDYRSAMDSLHRYFDYSAGKGGMNGNGVPSDASVGRFQSGLLALGSMHAHFGHVTQALQALNEAVHIAQQNNDHSCLVHTLAALCHLLSEVGVSVDTNTVGRTAAPGLDVEDGPLGVQQQLLLLLRRCLRRAVELRLAHLVAFSQFALAKFDLKHVRRLPLLGGLRTSGQLGTSPISVYNTLKLSPYLLSDSVTNAMPVIMGTASNLSTNPQRQGGTISTSVSTQTLSIPGSMVTAGGWLGLYGRLGPLPVSILQLAGASHLLKAAAWELYGSAPMLRISSLIHAVCYGDVASADDLSLAYIKLAQYLAAFKGYKQAFAALDVAASKFPLSTKSRIRVVRLQLIHERALHNGNIKLAQAACSELGALASPVHGVDMDLKIDASHRQARTLLAAGQFSEAASVAQSLFCMCYESNMQLESIIVLLLLADIHKKSGSAVTGLPYALASLTLSQSFNLDLVHATASVTLAELWLSLGVNHAQQALVLLHQSMPAVLGHGGLQLCGRTYLAVAQCYLCSPSFSVQTEHEKVLDALQSAAEHFELIEDYEHASEAFYLKSLVLNAIGIEQERDVAATAFRKYSVELIKAQATKVVVLPV